MRPSHQPLTPPPLRVVTTSPATAEREGAGRPVRLWRRHTVDSARLWVFTDGSGTGWHGAVLVRRGAAEHHLARRRRSASGSVSAELDGLALGLEHASGSTRVALVSDYLWSAYYVNGWWQVRRPALRSRVVHLRQLLAAFDDVLFVHYGVHPGARTPLARGNRAAHDLCSARAAVDRTLPWRQATVNGRADGASPRTDR